jgi:hypothetical protein
MHITLFGAAGEVTGSAYLVTTTPRDYRHPERACLAGQPGTVVVGPNWRRRQMRMQLPRNLCLDERILVGAGRRRNHDPCARQR